MEMKCNKSSMLKILEEKKILILSEFDVFFEDLSNKLIGFRKNISKNYDDIKKFIEGFTFEDIESLIHILSDKIKVLEGGNEIDKKMRILFESQRKNNLSLNKMLEEVVKFNLHNIHTIQNKLSNEILNQFEIRNSELVKYSTHKLLDIYLESCYFCFLNIEKNKLLFIT